MSGSGRFIRGGAPWLALALTLGAGCARDGGGDTAGFVTLGALRVAVSNRPAAPRAGENTLLVRVEDAHGAAVEGARVEVVATMPAMGAMPAMQSDGRVTAAGAGNYRAAYGLAMAGDWDVRVRVTAQGASPVEGDWRVSTVHGGIAFAGMDAGAAVTGDSGGAPGSAPGSASAASPGAIMLDAARRQSIGLATTVVSLRDLDLRLRARGTVVFDETHRAVVSPRYSGWVRRLAADFTGKAVQKGELLCTVDSPELRAAEEEYVGALRFEPADSTAHAMAFGGAPSLSLAEAARRRLLAWDIPPDVVAEVARRGQPLPEVPLRAPIAGVVVEKNVVAGSPIAPGQVLFAIASVDPAWIEARIAETDLAQVKVGASASVRAPGASDDRTGRVTFLAPSLDADSHSGVARIALANRGGALKPGMFVDVAIAVPLGRRLAVPEGAVVPTGTRNLVFVDTGGGSLVPRAVELGAHVDGWIEIVRGVTAGERVVTAGNFLVASDARLSAALKNW